MTSEYTNMTNRITNEYIFCYSLYNISHIQRPTIAPFSQPMFRVLFLFYAYLLVCFFTISMNLTFFFNYFSKIVQWFFWRNSLFLCTLQQEEINRYDITPEFYFIIDDEIHLIKLLLYNVSIPLSPHSPGLYFPIRENVRHG